MDMDLNKIKEFIEDENAHQCEIPLSEKAESKPYLEFLEIKKVSRYNPKYGDHKTCKCGHAYYRHFDTYDNMSNIGCKHCQCDEFVENIETKE